MPDEYPDHFAKLEVGPGPGDIHLAIHLPGTQRLAERGRTPSNLAKRVIFVQASYYNTVSSFVAVCLPSIPFGRSGVTSINLRLICPSMSACPARICNMGRPCTSTSTLINYSHLRELGPDAIETARLGWTNLKLRTCSTAAVVAQQ